MNKKGKKFSPKKKPKKLKIVLPFETEEIKDELEGS